MHGLDVFGMVISPSSSHPFRVPVVRYDVATVDKFLVTNGALSFLLDDFSIQQLPHLGWRTEFTIHPGVVWIIDAPNTKLKSAFLLACLLATAAEQGTVNRAVFIPTEFHGNAPV
jgi:hypothetical protein